MSRAALAFACLMLAALAGVPAAATGAPVLRVAYAGSMGAVMDEALGPAFAARESVRYEGTGQGSWALARLLAAGSLRADVFIGITPGPTAVLRDAGLLPEPVAVARTHMVLIYSPRSRHAAAFAAAAAGERAWHEVLRTPGLRFGRTDPEIDPQGANALFVLQLAARQLGEPDLLEAIAGPLQNPRQLFAETGLMARLEAGQIDATIGYASAARSHHLPVVALPAEIDLADPARREEWRRHAGFTLPGGRELHPEPLVFEAGVLANAAAPEAAQRFVAFLRSAAGQRLLAAHGYDPAP